MKTKLFLEPKGKAREEIALESSVPSEKKLYLKWKKSWIPKKEFQDLLKHSSPSPLLGELKEGKILQIRTSGTDGIAPKGKLYAFRSFIQDAAGGKKKLPLVLYGRVKSNFKTSDISSLSGISEKDLKTELKQDPWAPVAIWHTPPLKRSEVIPLEELIFDVVKYSNTLSQVKSQTDKWVAILETEIYR
ncbi:MAG: hypothetical protein ACW98Y_10820 [Candidatus Thorarchaeota archaeon]|jgi:hypothetical protein